MTGIYSIYTELLGKMAPSGNERNRGLALEAMIRPFVDETSFDAFGNLIAHRKGIGESIMLSAQLDTPGFIIHCIDDHGFPRFMLLGNAVPDRLVGTRIRFESGLEGLIMIEPRAGQRSEDIVISDLYADIAATSTEQAEKLVPVGSTAVYAGTATILADDSIMGPYCGPIATCAVLLEVARRQRDRKNDIHYVFAAQSQVGQRGVKAAVYNINPNVGVCLDPVLAQDGRGRPSWMATKVGKGPVIKIKDRSALYSRSGVKLLRDAAEALDIICQYEILDTDESENAATHFLNRGAITCGIGIPVRYLYGPTEILSLKDAEKTIQLLCKMVENI